MTSGAALRLAYPTRVVSRCNDTYLSCHVGDDNLRESARYALSLLANHLRAAGKQDGSDPGAAS